MSYIANLMLRLAVGTENLPEETRSRHAAYLAGAQNGDGGFAGRRGASDPYYTSFALRTLAMLGQLDDQPARRAAGFLKDRLACGISGIDFISLVIGAALLEGATGIDIFADAGRDRRQTVLDFLARFRRPDGGFAKTERSGPSSTYQTFLAVACQQLVGAPLDDAAAMTALIRARQREDGGFVELALMRQSGTNPTAAAVGLLAMLGARDEPMRTAAAAFLRRMQTAEGGLRAHARIPVADLLSTCTGLVALNELGALATIDLAGVRRFVESLERPAGGFRAGTWDDAVDVEYTFYGLGTLALLCAPED